MARFAERLEELLIVHKNDLLPLSQRNASDRQLDHEGVYTAALCSDLRLIGVGEFIMHRDVEAFRRNLSRSARLKLSLFERADSGEPISDSFLTMLAYIDVFDALAASDGRIAEALAQRMRHRDQLRKGKGVHSFDYALGSTLSAAIVDDRENFEAWTDQLDEICHKRGNASFQGYPEMFRALAKLDLEAANSGIKKIVVGHERLSKGHNIFADTEHEVLCIWGVGLANFARSRGLWVAAVPPLIPGELLIAPDETSLDSCS